MSAGIVPGEAADLDALADLWFRSARRAHPYLPQLQALDAAAARNVFRAHITPGLELWMIRDDDRPVAFLGMNGDLVDRLYVAPSHQGRGLGSRLLAFARTRSPDGLRLFTHRQNRAARRFYEARGFVVVRLGVSPPPESVPDVEYAWTPR